MFKHVYDTSKYTKHKVNCMGYEALCLVLRQLKKPRTYPVTCLLIDLIIQI